MQVWVRCEIFDFGVLAWPHHGHPHLNQHKPLASSINSADGAKEGTRDDASSPETTRPILFNSDSILRLRTVLEDNYADRPNIRYDDWISLALSTLGIPKERAGLIFDQYVVLTANPVSRTETLNQNERADGGESQMADEGGTSTMVVVDSGNHGYDLWTSDPKIQNAREEDWRNLLLFTMVQTLPYTIQQNLVTQSREVWQDPVSDELSSSIGSSVLHSPFGSGDSLSLSSKPRTMRVSTPPVTLPSGSRDHPPPPVSPRGPRERETMSTHSNSRLFDHNAAIMGGSSHRIALQSGSEIHNLDRHLEFLSNFLETLLMLVADLPSEYPDESMEKENGSLSIHEAVSPRQLDRLGFLLSAGQPGVTRDSNFGLSLSDVAPFWKAGSGSLDQRVPVRRVAEWLGGVIVHNYAIYPMTPTPSGLSSSPLMSPLAVTAQIPHFPFSPAREFNDSLNESKAKTQSPQYVKINETKSTSSFDLNGMSDIADPSRPLRSPQKVSVTLPEGDSVSAPPVLHSGLVSPTVHHGVRTRRSVDYHKGEPIVYDIVSANAVRYQSDIGNAGVVRIKRCQHSQIYIVASTPYVHITNCSQCTVFVGVATRVVLVENCEQVKLYCAARRVLLSNCSSCKFNLCISTPTLLMGDNHRLQFAPLSACYGSLASDLSNGGISPSLKHNMWSQHIDLNVLSKPEGAPKIDSRGSPARSICSLTPPSEFSSLIISFIVEGPTTESPFELPSEFQNSLDQKNESVKKIGEIVRETSEHVSPETAREIQDLIEGQFHEWLGVSGHTQGIRDLVRSRSPPRS